MDEGRRPDTTAEELDELKAAFIAAHERREARVDEWLREYPQHAPALLDLAFALELDASRQDEPSEEVVAYTADALRHALEQVREERARAVAVAAPFPQPAPGLVVRMRACGLGTHELARQLGLTSELVFKLDRGFVLLETVPQRLIGQLAAALSWPRETLVTALGRSAMTAGAMYYARDAPAVTRRQSFAEALAEAEGLPKEDREAWFETLREEGLVG